MASNLDKLTASLNKTGGVERMNDFFYYGSLSTNGFDSVGHYLRAGLVTRPLLELLAHAARRRGLSALFYDPTADAVVRVRRGRAVAEGSKRTGQPRPGRAPAPEPHRHPRDEGRDAGAMRA